MGKSVREGQIYIILFNAGLEFAFLISNRLLLASTEFRDYFFNAHEKKMRKQLVTELPSSEAKNREK